MSLEQKIIPLVASNDLGLGVKIQNYGQITPFNYGSKFYIENYFNAANDNFRSLGYLVKFRASLLKIYFELVEDFRDIKKEMF